jgi:Domain of unknown function (DUF4326)
MKPKRIQLRRTKGWRMPAKTVKVDRTTLFGNPFSIEDYGHDRAVELHRAWIAGKIKNHGIPASRMKMLMELREKVLAALPTLRGKNLACWCPLPEAGQRDNCHAALLLELANPRQRGAGSGGARRGRRTVHRASKLAQGANR